MTISPVPAPGTFANPNLVPADSLQTTMSQDNPSWNAQSQVLEAEIGGKRVQSEYAHITECQIQPSNTYAASSNSAPIQANAEPLSGTEVEQSLHEPVNDLLDTEPTSMLRQLALDFIPTVVFFATYAIAGPYIATVVGMGIAILQIMYLLARRQPVDMLLWVNTALLGLCGGAALFFDNVLFIKCKPAVMSLLFAGGLLVSKYFWDRNLIEELIGKKRLPVYEKTWTQLNLNCAGFLASLAIVELIVVVTCSTKTWAMFKLFGAKTALITFAIGQLIWLDRQPQFGRTSPSLSNELLRSFGLDTILPWLRDTTADPEM